MSAMKGKTMKKRDGVGGGGSKTRSSLHFEGLD